MPVGDSTYFFLGSNSPGGFFSLYDQLIDLNKAEDIFIIKGGPGCGKSSFMRFIGDRLSAAGAKIEYILCSGDPDSLDAIIIPQLKTAFVDGTAPHVIEPKYPAVVESYINLGEFYVLPEIKKSREKLTAAFGEYKKLYNRAYKCIEATKIVTDDIRNIVVTDELKNKIRKRSMGIISREIEKNKKKEGKLIRRFLRTVTCYGEICRYDTAEALCTQIYELNDNFGLSHYMLEPIADAAVEAGYEVVVCYDPMIPDRIEHVLIPEISKGFVSSGALTEYKGNPYRRIRLDAMIDSDIISKNRGKIRLIRKITRSLMDEAVDSLKRAKHIHDEIEAVYNPNVKFEEVYQLAETMSEKLLIKWHALD